MHIRIASRQSKLALIQTNLVIEEINKHFPDITCEIVQVVTTGDKITNINLYDIGGKALFLKELEERLIAGEADMAVHSLKDVPGVLPDGMQLSAVLEREDPRDCFVSHKYKSVDELPEGAIVGSSSVRRKVVLEKIRPDLKIVACRGNIQTRLGKIESENLDAIILACAGLKRAELFDPSFCYPFEIDEMIPGAGQGIITVQTRCDDKEMEEICAKINHLPTWYLAQAEREFLAYFDASCRTPIAAYAEYIDDLNIRARYMYGDFDGSFLNFATETGGKLEGKEIAVRAAGKCGG